MLLSRTFFLRILLLSILGISSALFFNIAPAKAYSVCLKVYKAENKLECEKQYLNLIGCAYRTADPFITYDYENFDLCQKELPQVDAAGWCGQITENQSIFCYSELLEADRCNLDPLVQKSQQVVQIKHFDSYPECFRFEAQNKRRQQVGQLTTVLQDVKISKPLFEIRIPGLSFTEVKNTLDTEGNIHLPWIGEFLTVIYRLSMGVASIVAVVMLIINGIRIVVSAGGEEKTAAYKRIGQIIVGLIILWGSYSLLYIINPNLVTFKALKIKYIQAIPLNLADKETEEATEQLAGKVQAGKVLVIRKSQFIANDMLVGEQMADDLKKAAEELYNETKGLQGGPFKLAGGGYRPLSDGGDSQVEKWIRQCEGKPKCGTPVCNPFPKPMIDANNFRIRGAVPDPTLCPHTAGRALDIYCQGGSTDQFFAPCQRKLEEIFLRKNFCRLTSEPWHFERPQVSKSCTTITGKASRKKTNETWDYSTCNGTYIMKTKTCASVQTKS